MKKVISLTMTLAMIFTICVLLAVPAVAVDGEWIVYSKADHYEADYDGDIMSIPGYEYNDEGLRIISADWKDFNPGAGMQTKEKLDIKEGVYMKVRIDEFNYESDHWFNFHIYSREMMKAGKSDTEKWGYGFQELIRYNPNSGKWGIEWATGGFEKNGTTTIDPSNISMDANGVVEFEFEVKWDGATFALSINNTPAPQAVIDYMNETYTKEDAYVGFNFQNNTKGGKCGCTLLEFGTGKKDATIPMGDDSREPENFYLDVSEIADPSTVEAGKPAIYMNGNRTGSDSKIAPSVGNGSATINDDYSVHLVASDTSPYLNFSVKNTVSYDIDDFPVAFVMTRDFCTCGEDVCYALESSNMYIMTGDTIGASSEVKVNELDMALDPTYIDGHSYLYFYYDFSSEITPFDAEGRINGCRFDFVGVDVGTAGKNALDVCFAAFFKTVEEAEEFAKAYFTELGWTETVETEPVVDTETDPAVETTVGTIVETDTEVETTVGTTVEAETEVETKVETNNKPVEDTTPEEKETDAPASGGCGSIVGFGAIAVVALVAACGAVAFKKEN